MWNETNHSNTLEVSQLETKVPNYTQRISTVKVITPNKLLCKNMKIKLANISQVHWNYFKDGIIHDIYKVLVKMI